MTSRKKPLLLMILDGWGYREESDYNAIAQAHTPCWDQLWKDNPHSLLDTSGEAVGLPAGQMGNSEVGHMNIGAGRIVYQDFTRISLAIRDGSFQNNAALCEGIEAAARHKGTVHVMGLLSPGGVHSHDEHFQATVKLAQARGASRIAVHLFLDGRDTPPRSAADSIAAMQALVNGISGAQIYSVCGRYFAMDRDQRWDRVQRAYKAIVDADSGLQAPTAAQALNEAYERGENDEFVQPTVITGAAPVADGDSVIFINFRADRAREITRAFVESAFTGFERRQPRLAAFVSMTEYQQGLDVSIAFPPAGLPRLFGEILAEQGLRQLRIAETEKYAHVTFCFNGGREQAYPLEQRILIPSPKVATYDLQPEMSAPELAEQLARAIRSDGFDVIICNVANPDMVGHTGSMKAAMAAVEAVDQCLAKVLQAIDEQGGEMLITADHGNVEQMLDPVTGQSLTSHTTNPVPLLFHGRAGSLQATGTLRDIAPTMLHLLGLQQPTEMTGHSLFLPDAE
ncbi:MAG TPA: 2,3-bisphosphoglycerate-independent phosphoglycerate mutase [Xanthomonadales bacterium]|nr:2,3-bisphosphoglycerate-independent phosphoglycerate mutase [Xanthomonadales bacterium]